MHHAVDFLETPLVRWYGFIHHIQGLMMAVTFKHPTVHLGIGYSCMIEKASNHYIQGEIVGFHQDKVLVMPMGVMVGLGPGKRVYFSESPMAISPTKNWVGRVINAWGDPVDNKGPLEKGHVAHPLINSPIPAFKRTLIKERISVGVKAIDTFLTCCDGQRMGVFAGSGVGKSMLMSMIAKFHTCDVCVIGLIGERGREVKEFIHKTLGEEGLKKSVVVVATSDEPALMRRQAAYMAMALSEYFSSQGQSVLCLLDSVTRFAMAQREIGLSVGEPPTTKGYPPSVFSELPRLLERAGPGMEGHGGITGFFTVLVDGDDHNEPIADAVRGILDGHIVLDRSLAERNHFPAINILKSISRMVPHCHSDEEQDTIRKARQVLSTFNDMKEMIRLGAYRMGSDPSVDEAVRLDPKLSSFLVQRPLEHYNIDESFLLLRESLK